MVRVIVWKAALETSLGMAQVQDFVSPIRGCPLSFVRTMWTLVWTLGQLLLSTVLAGGEIVKLGNASNISGLDCIFFAFCLCLFLTFFAVSK